MTAFKDTFRIGLWEGPRLFAVPTDTDMDTRFREIREAGIDTIFLFAELQDPGWLDSTLAAAERNGLFLIIDTSAVWRDADRRADIVHRTKDCPAVIAYNIMDEPPAALIDELAPAAAWYRGAAPDKTVFVNLNPNYAPPPYLPAGETRRERYRAYLDAFLSRVPVDVLSLDFYPYVGAPDAEARMKTAMLENLADAALAARVYGIPLAGFLQTARWGRFDDNTDRTSPWHGTRLPGESELRWLANLHLVFGAKMLTDFLYWSRSGTRPDQRVPGVFDGIMWEDGTRSPLYPIVQRVHAEARAAAEVLQPCTFEGILTAGLTDEENAAVGELRLERFGAVNGLMTDGRVIAGCFTSPDGGRLLYVMNADDSSDSGDGGNAAQLTVGMETVRLQPGEGKVIQL
ncbi:MAG: hypothetical protein MJ192_07785 [Clostridia bacterium]|nr:hypothetical protein [Clostridia bacterium]